MPIFLVLSHLDFTSKFSLSMITFITILYSKKFFLQYFWKKIIKNRSTKFYILYFQEFCPKNTRSQKNKNLVAKIYKIWYTNYDILVNKKEKIMIDILIVEDNKEIATLLSDFLKKENYIVSIAQTGEKALSIYEKYGARLVLLDVMLPRN